MFKLFSPIIRIEFPALDRLMAYLEAGQQSQIDELTKRLQAANDRLAAKLSTFNK